MLLLLSPPLWVQALGPLPLKGEVEALSNKPSAEDPRVGSRVLLRGLRRQRRPISVPGQSRSAASSARWQLYHPKAELAGDLRAHAIPEGVLVLAGVRQIVLAAYVLGWLHVRSWALVAARP